jgi:carbon monoxide dehydrogenase subunit G
VTTIQISVNVSVSPQVLWEELRHIDRHVNWMNDAVSITFISPTTEGVGTQFSCLTKVGPFKTTDQMTITQWEENKTMGVEHTGLVKGTGTFQIHPHGEGSTITWKESLSFPLFFLGPLGALAATPLLTYIWKKNLTNLKNIVEQHS